MTTECLVSHSVDMVPFTVVEACSETGKECITKRGEEGERERANGRGLSAIFTVHTLDWKNSNITMHIKISKL